MSLLDISNQIAAYYGLLVESLGVGGSNFGKVKLDIEETPFSFLSELARQRGAIISNTPEGFLRLWKAVKTGDPVARLAEGSQPVLKVAAAFSPQEYFSEITGFGRAKKKKRGGKYTLHNPLLHGALHPIRPKCFAMGDTEPGDVPSATTAKMSRMFGNVASYTIDLATWRDPQGELWAENTTVMLAAPQAMIYGEFEFLIRTVNLHQDENSSNAQLGVVLPGAFSDGLPDRLPWED
jgi:prophage tail gpP-like protein